MNTWIGYKPIDGEIVNIIIREGRRKPINKIPILAIYDAKKRGFRTILDLNIYYRWVVSCSQILFSAEELKIRLNKAIYRRNQQMKIEEIKRLRVEEELQYKKLYYRKCIANFFMGLKKLDYPLQTELRVDKFDSAVSLAKYLRKFKYDLRTAALFSENYFFGLEDRD